MWGVVRKRERVKEWGQKAQRESRRGFTLFFPNFVRYLDHGFSENLEDVQIHRGKSQSKMQFNLVFDLHQILQ